MNSKTSDMLSFAVGVGALVWLLVKFNQYGPPKVEPNATSAIGVRG